MNKKVVNSLSSLLTILIFCFIGFLLIATYQAQKNSNEIPSYFGYKPFTVLTNSMEPRISAGDMVFVKEKKASQIKKGDIITFALSDQKIITHRVAKVTSEGFLTKGDQNNVKDSWIVKPESVIGEVKLTFPRAGYISKFAASKIGFFLFIILPLLLYVLIEIFQRVLSGFEHKQNEIAQKI